MAVVRVVRIEREAEEALLFSPVIHPIPYVQEQLGSIDIGVVWKGDDPARLEDDVEPVRALWRVCHADHARERQRREGGLYGQLRERSRRQWLFGGGGGGRQEGAR